MATADIHRRRQELKAEAQRLQRELELSQIAALDSFFANMKERADQYERSKAEFVNDAMSTAEFYDEQADVLRAINSDVENTMRETAVFLISELGTPIGHVAKVLGVGKTTVWRWTQQHDTPAD